MRPKLAVVLGRWSAARLLPSSKLLECRRPSFGFAVGRSQGPHSAPFASSYAYKWESLLRGDREDRFPSSPRCWWPFRIGPLPTRVDWLSLVAVGALRTAADRVWCYFRRGFVSYERRLDRAYSTPPAPSTSCFRILRLVLLRLVTVSRFGGLLLLPVPNSSASCSHAACTPRRA